MMQELIVYAIFSLCFFGAGINASVVAADAKDASDSLSSAWKLSGASRSRFSQYGQSYAWLDDVLKDVYAAALAAAVRHPIHGQIQKFAKVGGSLPSFSFSRPFPLSLPSPPFLEVGPLNQLGTVTPERI